MKKYAHITQSTYIDTSVYLYDTVHYAENDRFTMAEVVDVLLTHTPDIWDLAKEHIDDDMFEDLLGDLVDSKTIGLVDIVENVTDVEDLDTYMDVHDALEVLGFTTREVVAWLDGYILGTAGYSPWCEYITHEDNEDLAKDLYEGHNFYNITIVDEDNNELDSTWDAWMRSDDDLLDMLSGMGYDDVDGLIVDEYFNLLKEVPRFKVVTTQQKVVAI